MDLHDETEDGSTLPRLSTADGISAGSCRPGQTSFEDYCVGLLMSAEGRKSVEPLAAVTAPERTRLARHQSVVLHLVAQAPWSDQAVLEPCWRKRGIAIESPGTNRSRPGSLMILAFRRRAATRLV